MSFPLKPPMWAPGTRQGHPLGIDCRAFWWMPEAGGTITRDAVNGFLATHSAGSQWSTASVGCGMRFGDNATDKASVPNNLRLEPTSVTIWGVVEYTVNDNYNVLLDKAHTAHVAPFQRYHLRRDINGDVRFACAIAGVSRQKAAAGGTPTLNVPYQIAATYNKLDGSVRIYVNGTVAATDAWGTGGITYAGDVPLEIGNWHNLDDAEGQIIYAAGIWGHALLSAEIEWLYREPWDLITPRRREYFWIGGIGAGGAGGPNGGREMLLLKVS